MSTRTFRLATLLTVAVALLVPLAAAGAGTTGSKPRAAGDAVKRVLYATDDRGNLLRFRALTPQLVASKQITGSRPVSA